MLVIGGGAGGLAAALAARRAGAEVVLLDERGVAGGQYYKQPAAGRGRPRSTPSRPRAAGWREAVAALRGGRVVPECEVWGAFPGDGGRGRRSPCPRLLVASSATGRPG